MNEILLLGEIIFMYALMYVGCSLFGKKGLVLWIFLGYMFFMIFGNSMISIFGLPVNSGTVIYATSIVAMNMILQKYGKDDLSKIWYIIVIGLTLVYVCLLLVNKMTVPSNLVNSIYFDTAFNIPLRVYLGLILTSYITIHFNGYLYYEIRLMKNKIWVSNLLSVIVYGFVDTVIFSVIAFAGIINTMELIMLIIMVTILKIIIGILGTFLIYKDNKIN